MFKGAPQTPCLHPAWFPAMSGIFGHLFTCFASHFLLRIDMGLDMPFSNCVQLPNGGTWAVLQLDILQHSKHLLFQMFHSLAGEQQALKRFNHPFDGTSSVSSALFFQTNGVAHLVDRFVHPHEPSTIKYNKI